MSISPESLTAAIDETRKPDEPEAEAVPEVQFEWQPVSGWPTEVIALMDDIEAIEATVKLLFNRKGTYAADQLLYTKTISILEDALLGRRLELCEAILKLHGLDLPDE